MLDMKNKLKLIFGIAVLALAFTSCKKDENRVVYQGGTAPVLTASSTAPQVLLKANKDNPALSLTWTNPDYKFNTGVSSQDVTYTVQVDTAGKNFTSAGMQEKAIAKDLRWDLTVKDLNQLLSKMELKAGTTYDVEIRVKSTLINNSVPLYSNVLKIKLTPYLDFAVEPPGTAAANYNDGTLWVVGDAFAGGWNNPLQPPYDVTQKFTKVDVLHYELIATFNATGGYKLVQTMGVWGTQYHALDGTAALSGDFEKRDADPQFPSPGAGSYKIQVNFQTGKYTLTRQ
jgi:hypothetical protein